MEGGILEAYGYRLSTEVVGLITKSKVPLRPWPKRTPPKAPKSNLVGWLGDPATIENQTHDFCRFQL